MKETEFISQNEAKWARFEQLYANKKSHPGELSDLYFDLTNDLSYSQTFYRRRTVRAYLNQLAQAVFTTVHNNKRPSAGGVFHFWFNRLPIEIHQSRANIQLALMSFLLYATIGALAAHFIPHFVEAILGKAYVIQTMQNIRNGNPLGIYDSSSQFDMFVMIASNNLKVAFIMFSAGYLMTLGTHYFLFANGIMIGAFQYLFYSQGLLETSFLGIWMHGAFEVSAIIIAAGAGITAGKGWMFPSSHSRFEAFQLATKRAVKIMVSLVPFILLAAFIESYVTHHYDVLPAWSKWLIILGSFGVILFFYFIFPLIASQKFKPIPQELVRPKRVGQTRINVYKIRTTTELITDAFSLYRSGFSDLSKVMFGIFLPCGMILILAQAFIYGSPTWVDANLVWYDYVLNMFGISKESPPQFIIYGCWTLLFSFVFAAVGHSILRQIGSNNGNGQFSFILRKTPLFWLGSVGLWIILIFPIQILIFAVFLIPCASYQGPLLSLDDRRFGVKLGLTAKYFFANWKPMFGALIVLVIFLFILLQPIAGILSFSFQPGEVVMYDLLDYMAQNVQNIANGLGEDSEFYTALVRKSVYLIVLMFLIPYLGFLFLLNYYGILEARELTSLKQALALFGKRKKVSEGEIK